MKNDKNEFMNKAKDCKTVDEVMALANEEGVELTEEEMNNISGGVGTVPGSKNTEELQ